MELDYRNSNEVIIRCACGSSHFYSFSYEAGEEDWDGEPYCQFYIESIAQDYSLWDRIKTALRYIFRGDRCLYGSFELTADDCYRIATLMGEYIDEVEALDAREKCKGKYAYKVQPSKTALGAELRRIREKAIAEGLELMTLDEIAEYLGR